MITARHLISWGLPPGAWFKASVAAAEAVRAAGGDQKAMIAAARAEMPPTVATLPLRSANDLLFSINILPEGEDELANVAAVFDHMTELMRVPTVVGGTVMPDACPSGSPLGTVPVGGVIETVGAIHPGMHSADICCSMAVTYLPHDVDMTRVLDLAMQLSHFGPGGRARGAQIRPPAFVMDKFEGNPFLANLTSGAIDHFATQGDGNHFLSVGRSDVSGSVCITTHHGSRNPGARLYKAGMVVAEYHRLRLSPETGKHNAWIPADTREGDDYWDALQAIRLWTRESHFAIHEMIRENLGVASSGRHWNEHNFVFRKANGRFYHAKGATPAWSDYADDAGGLTVIPMNMAEPILVVIGSNAPHALGFSPHGAGRNLSRTAYMKRNAGKTDAEMIAEQAPGIDVRFFCGEPDVSELPHAYKDAASLRNQISHFGLAEIVDTIQPYGTIMCGDSEKFAHWRIKRAAKALAKQQAEVIA